MVACRCKTMGNNIAKCLKKAELSYDITWNIISYLPTKSYFSINKEYNQRALLNTSYYGSLQSLYRLYRKIIKCESPGHEATLTFMLINCCHLLD